MTQRTLSEKVQDIKSTYAQFSEMLTEPELREMLDQMTGPEARAAVAATGDIRAVVQMTQASMDLYRAIAGNNRAALMAAVMAAGSGGTRIVPPDEESLQ